MKISQNPASAFAIYSEKLKQKKIKKIKAENLVKKSAKKKNVGDLKTREMKEIGNILKTLAQQSAESNSNMSKIFKNTSKGVSLTFSPIKNNVNKNVKLLATTGKQKMKKPNVHGKKIGEKDGRRWKEEHNYTLSTNGHIKDFDIEEINTKTTNGPSGRRPNIESVNSAGSKQSIGEPKHSKIKSNVSNKINKSKLKKKKIVVNKITEAIISNKHPNNIPTIDSTTFKQVIDDLSRTLSKENDSDAKQSLSAIKKKKKLSTKKPKLDFKQKRIEKDRKQLINHDNSILSGKRLFEWLIRPVTEPEFSQEYWEKRPLLIKRDENRNYYSKLLSTPEIDDMLRNNVVYFTKHIDVTSYTDGERQTHNIPGRAQANVVWDFYSNGCSIRLLNPQAFMTKIHTLLATLQGYFGCFVGSNVYLTPPDSQGFAPHYDDIEAFVLQIEGKKRWKVYSPRNESEMLPRYSSPNFSQDEIGEPILDMVLEPGDMLYFPRGFIHQACTVEGEHSLHITLSAYQKTAWVDLLEKALPLALKKAAAKEVEFRSGLPRNYLGIEYLGNNEEKQQFLNSALSLFSKLGPYLSASLGDAVDRMGAQFIHDALPPAFANEEVEASGLGGGLKMKENGTLVNRVEIKLNTRVKLIRANICRLVEEEDQIRLYHCLDNPLEYHAEEPQFLDLPPEGVPVITHLFQSYPSFTEVKSIPHDDDDVLLRLMSDLWDVGLLVTRGLSTTKP